MKLLAILTILIGMIGCASGRHVVNIACPKPPIMFRVEVKDKTIKGKDVDHAIENHQRLWQHIELLEKLGCKAR